MTAFPPFLCLEFLACNVVVSLLLVGPESVLIHAVCGISG